MVSELSSLENGCRTRLNVGRMKSGSLRLCGLLAGLALGNADAASLRWDRAVPSITPALAQFAAPGFGREAKPRTPKVLTVPEPSTYALAAGAASLALCAWVRRRGKH